MLLAAGQSGYYNDNNDNYANDYDDYQDYGDQGGGGGGGEYEDHLYHDYAARQQEKMAGGIGGGGYVHLRNIQKPKSQQQEQKGRKCWVSSGFRRTCLLDCVSITISVARAGWLIWIHTNTR